MDRFIVPGTAYYCPSCKTGGYTSTTPVPETCSCGRHHLTEELLPNPRARVHKDSVPDSVYVAAMRRMGAFSQLVE